MLVFLFMEFQHFCRITHVVHVEWSILRRFLLGSSTVRKYFLLNRLVKPNPLSLREWAAEKYKFCFFKISKLISGFKSSSFTDLNWLAKLKSILKKYEIHVLRNKIQKMNGAARIRQWRRSHHRAVYTSTTRVLTLVWWSQLIRNFKIYPRRENNVDTLKNNQYYVRMYLKV